MKRFCSTITLLLITTFFSFAQNIPTIGTVTSNVILTNTTDNYIIVGNITDGDIGVVQSVTVTANSSNNTILSITGIDVYTSTGENFAKLKVKQFNLSGMVTITVTATDINGTLNKTFSISVGNFYPKGCRWNIYDIVFWQNAFPTDNETYKLDSILPRVELPTNTAIWQNIGMTAGPIQLGGGFTFHDGYTTGYRGVIIPTLTGVYMFTMDYQDGGEFRISSSGKYNDAFQIGGFRKRTEGVPQVITDTVYLVAGRSYGYKCAYWTVFAEQFALRWAYLGTNPTIVTTVTSAAMPTNQAGTTFLTNTPLGINMFIPGFYARTLSAGAVNFSVLGAGGALQTYPYYDLFKPTVSGLTLLRKGTNVMDFKWNPALFDTSGISNYKIYVNGVLRFTTKNDKQTNYVLSGLTPNTGYTVFVTTTDKAGNESEISNVISDVTFPTDVVPPSAPNSLVVNYIGDMSAVVSWSGATDNASGIFGYRIFVDNVQYNRDTLNSNSIILKTFQPTTSHTFQVQAIDGSFNASTLSTATNFTTLAYNPLLSSPGVKKLQLNVTKDFIGKIDGFGINAGYNDYTIAQINRIKALNAGLVRWGTLDANTLSYAASSSGSRTYAKFINFANAADAAASISIGTDATLLIDWRDETVTNVTFGTNTVSMKVMERTAQQMIAYLFAPDSMATKNLAGPSFYPYHADVQKRLNEGFRQSTFTGVTSPFKHLIIEFGNEVWGGTTFGQAGTVDHNADGFTDYLVYGTWARQIARAFKTSPYYDSTRIKLSYSGREPQPINSNGLTEALFAGTDEDRGDLLSPGGYLGGNLNYSPQIPTAESELGYYRNSFELMYKNINGLYATKNLDNTFRKKQRSFFFYETAMTKPTYNQRMGQAVVLTDYILSAHKAGAYYPGIFVLSGGEWGITQLNGTVFNPMYKAAQLINNTTKGNRDILNTSVITNERVLNENGQVITSLGSFLEPVSTNIFHKNGVYSLVLLSRDFTDDFQVQLTFPSGMLLTPTVSGARMFVFTSTSDFSASTSNVVSSTVSISNNMIVAVPKYAMVVITFGGEILAQNNQQLGFSAYRNPTSVNFAVDNPSLLVQNQYESISFFATVTGGVAGSTAVGWNIIKPDSVTTLQISYDNGGKTLRFDTYDCQSNGIITVTGFLVSNPNLRSPKYVVTIVGQLGFGQTSCIAEVSVQSASISGSNTISNTNGSAIYTSSYSPTNAVVNTSLGWNTTLNGIATFDANTRTLTATQQGNGVVYIQSAYGTVTSNVIMVTISNNSQNQFISGLSNMNVLFSSSSQVLNGYASSSLPITYSSSNTSILSISNNTMFFNNLGVVTITASQAGNSQYNAAPTIRFVVTVSNNAIPVTSANISGSNSINIAGGSNIYTSNYLPANANSNTSYIWNTTLNGIATFDVNTGTLTTSQQGNGVVYIQSVYGTIKSNIITVTISNNKQNQTITGLPFSLSNNVGTTYNLTAVASSGLPVSYTSNNNSIVSISSGNILNFNAAGTANITASQSGNPQFNPANQVVLNVQVIAGPVSTTQPSFVISGKDIINVLSPETYTVSPVIAGYRYEWKLQSLVGIFSPSNVGANVIVVLEQSSPKSGLIILEIYDANNAKVSTIFKIINLPTSLPSQISNVEFGVSPNPGSSTIQFKNRKNDVKIYNSLGILLKYSNQDFMDISDLSQGIYIIEHQNKILKWVKE